MEHVDVVDTRDMGLAISQTTLHVSIPFSNNPSGRYTNVSGESPSNHNRSPRVLAKPTLDPSCIRFCPLDRWVLDSQVFACMAHGCNVSFSLFNRKHHCRICGRLFCAACCSQTVTVHRSRITNTSVSRRQPSYSADGADSFSASIPPSRGHSPCPGARVPHKETAAGGVSPQSSVSSALPTPTASSAMAASGSFAAATNASSSTCRICSSCHYEIQLVVARRDESGDVRRKCRGELKMLQWSLLVRMLTYLSRVDILEVSLVSSDFYFMSRDNLIWYHYNMARCKDEELQLNIPQAQPSSRRYPLRTQQYQTTVKTSLDDVSASDASKRVISLHSRYNFTQFLDFARRQEMARCKGLCNFATGARMLLSSPLKIAIVGASGIGKTRMVECFVNSVPADPPRPTMGFTRYHKIVHLTGGLAADVMLHIFDISGEPRYEELRRFICSSCHAVGLCYDARRKDTLVEAANLMMGAEPALRAQPVVLCGIRSPPPAHAPEPPPEREVTEVNAEDITVRGRGSVQCAWNRSEQLFQTIVQCLLDRLSLATSTPRVPAKEHTSPAEVERERAANRTAALELLQLTLNASAVDVLLDRNEK